MSGRVATREALALVGPFMLWGLGFILLYAGHGTACSIGAEREPARLVLAGLFLLTAAAHGWLCWWLWQRLGAAPEGPLRFVRLAGFTLSVAALVTTLWTGSPVLLLSICR